MPLRDRPLDAIEHLMLLQHYCMPQESIAEGRWHTICCIIHKSATVL